MVPRESFSVTSRQEEQVTIAAVRAGSEAAFMKMVAQHHGSLVRVAGFFAPGLTGADDLAETTWSLALMEVAAAEDCPSVRSWLLRAMMRSILSEHSREETASSGLDRNRFSPLGDRWEGHWATPPTDWSDAPDDDESVAAARAEILVALRSLPERERATIVLHDVEGLLTGEVCSILNLSEPEQRQLLHRARTSVRAALERLHDRRGQAP